MFIDEMNAGYSNWEHLPDFYTQSKLDVFRALGTKAHDAFAGSIVSAKCSFGVDAEGWKARFGEYHLLSYAGFRERSRELSWNSPRGRVVRGRRSRDGLRLAKAINRQLIDAGLLGETSGSVGTRLLFQTGPYYGVLCSWISSDGIRGTISLTKGEIENAFFEKLLVHPVFYVDTYETLQSTHIEALRFEIARSQKYLLEEVQRSSEQEPKR